MAEWSLVLEPVEENPDPSGKNMNGLALYIEDTEGDRREFSRIAYKRRNSKNPTRGFKRQVIKEIADAREVLDTLANADQLVAEVEGERASAQATRDRTHAAATVPASRGAV